MHGVMLADGTLLYGSCGESGNELEITTSIDETLDNIRKLMNPECTKTITFYVNVPIAVYEGYTKFVRMMPDAVGGKMNFWLTKE